MRILTIMLVSTVLVANVLAEDFHISGYEHLDVNKVYVNGTILNHATADFVAGGYAETVTVANDGKIKVKEPGGDYGINIYTAYAYNNSQIEVGGGEIGFLYAYDDTKINIKGNVYGPRGYGNSRINVYAEGKIGNLRAYDDSIFRISGGGKDYANLILEEEIKISEDYEFFCTDNSIVEVNDMHIWWTVIASGNSNVLFDNVECYEVKAEGNSIVEIVNSEIDNCNSFYRNFNVHDFSLLKLKHCSITCTDISVSGSAILDFKDVGFLSPSNEEDHFGISLGGSTTANFDSISFKGSLSCSGNSTVNVYNGYLYTIDHSWIGPAFPFCGGVSLSSTMNLYNGTIEVLKMRSGGILNFYNGQIGNSESFSGLFTSENCIVNMLGGEFYNLVDVNDNSKFNMSGGKLWDDLETLFTSEAVISGGTVAGQILASDSSKITLIGRDFAINGSPVDYGVYTSADFSSGRITGTLANGDLLDNNFAITGDSSIVLAEDPILLMAPEDGSVITSSDGIESLKILWKEPVEDYNRVQVVDESGNSIGAWVDVNDKLMEIRFDQKLLYNKYTVQLTDVNTNGLLYTHSGIELQHRRRADINNE